MNTRFALLLVSLLIAQTVCASEDFFERLDDALNVSALNNQVRTRFSGSIDLEGYYLEKPGPGLLDLEHHTLFNPRLTLFLDSQIGDHFYAFAQSRADRGFDPSNEHMRVRLDEYALRFTPDNDTRFNIQIGKFATVVGNWVSRHGSWDNPFITAPLVYENLTGIWDFAPARSGDMVLFWAGLKPKPSIGGQYLDRYKNVPVIWGPNYASGASVFGEIGKVEYAFELKNTSLSSRPEEWSVSKTQWQHPTWSGRLGYQPNEMWNLGLSASTGTYLLRSAGPSIPMGRSLDAYRESVIAQDIRFAWHHWQLWAEAYEARFAIPGLANVDTYAYYIEAKYKFTPQFSGALRWNQQCFGKVRDGLGNSTRWGRNTSRIDIGPEYRFTPFTQLKVQYSLQHEDADQRTIGQMLATQLTLRF